MSLKKESLARIQMDMYLNIKTLINNSYTLLSNQKEDLLMNVSIIIKWNMIIIYIFYNYIISRTIQIKKVIALYKKIQILI